MFPNVQDLVSVWKLTKADEVFAFSPPTFDPSIVDIWGTVFFSGAILCLGDPCVAMSDSLAVVRTLDCAKPTVCHMTPSMFDRLVAASWTASSVRLLSFGGESFPSVNSIRRILRPEGSPDFVNLYGVTEVSVVCCCVGVVLISDWFLFFANAFPFLLLFLLLLSKSGPALFP